MLKPEIVKTERARWMSGYSRSFNYLTTWRVGEIPSDPECNETSRLQPAAPDMALLRRAPALRMTVPQLTCPGGRARA